MDPSDDFDEFSPKRHFTLEEATRTLPLVQRIAKDIVEVYGQLVTDYERYQRFCPEDLSTLDEAHRDELASVQRQLQDQQRRIHEYAEELLDIGVLLKGEADGLVDFPALYEGRTVFLCWRLGEPRIDHWHEVAAGFNGRQSILPGQFDAADANLLQPQSPHDAH